MNRALNPDDDDEMDWSGAEQAIAAGQPQPDQPAPYDLSDASSWSSLPPPTPEPAAPPAPSVVSARPDAAAPSSVARSSKLDALQSIIDSGGEEDSAIRSAAANDRKRADQRQLSEYLASGLTGRPAQQLAQGPGDLDTEKLIQANRDKRAAAAKKAEPKAEDPSLSAWRLAQADHEKSLTAVQRDELERRKASDTEKATEAQRKADAAAAGKETEKTEARAILKAVAESAGGKRAGVDPNAEVNTRAGLEAYLRTFGLDKVAAKTAAKGGPAAPLPKAGEIDQVPEEMRETVRAIGEGRAKAPDPGSRFGAHILSMVNAVYPGFDSTKFGAYKDVREKLAKSDDMVAVDVARTHLDQARQLIPKNYDAAAANRIVNSFRRGSGDSSLTGFDATVKAAADEVAKAYGNNSEAGRQTVEHLLDSAQSPEQLKTVLDTFEHLLAGKQKGMQAQFERVAPKGATLSTEGAAPDAGTSPTEAQVTVTNKRTGASKQMSATDAQKYQGQPGYEVR